jgi:hypothetical protein
LRIFGNPALAPPQPLSSSSATSALPVAPKDLTDLLLQTLGGVHK